MLNVDDPHAFRSIKQRWIYNPPPAIRPAVTVSGRPLPPPVAEVLQRRGIVEPEAMEAFLETPLADLQNPFDIKDMDVAAERLARAVIEGEHICIYGDYDVDGVTSVALMYLFLSELGAKVTTYIPNRLEEGYGMNLDAMDEIKQKGATLIVTVDCGITATEEVAHAAANGMDVIITDHHQPGECLPEAAVAVVNPMRADDTSTAKNLAGVGVAFKTIMALRWHLRQENYFDERDLPNLKKYLDIVTLGTIADVVPLTGENRIFVRHGLKLLGDGSTRPGLRELKRITNLEGQNITTVHVGFVIAPRINAVGRLGEPDRGLRLLITDNPSEARMLAEELDNENRYRQEIEKKILAESFERIESQKLHEKFKGLVIASHEWHPGVIGIVASRIVEKYFRPTIVITMENGVGKGSARSIPKFHLYNGLEELSGMLLSFGGHKYAAGLKVAESEIENLQDAFDAVVTRMLEPDDFLPEISIDAMVESADIDHDLIEWLDRVAPFGAGNREPVFMMSGVRITQGPTYVGRDGAHLKMVVEKDGKRFDCIGFNMRRYEDEIQFDGTFDLLFSPSINRWNGGAQIQLGLKDLKRVTP